MNRNLQEKSMNISGLKASAKTIRALSIDAIEKAQSGHPGLPMGCAEIGSYLWGEILHHNPEDTAWLNRDRFILSAGHGSMLLYSLMHLSGYDISVDDIKNFRQLKSKTPGHPEYGWTDGVETTTGPLGQGFGNAVGMALAAKQLGQKFNREGLEIINHKVYVIAGDGDMMEGVTYESASLAGHLQLDNLVVIYDSNKITIEGSTDITFTENIPHRFSACGWHVLEIDGHDYNDIEKAFQKVKKGFNKPVLIIANTEIGKGSPNKGGTNLCHGAPLGTEECCTTKECLLITEDFFVDEDAVSYFNERKDKLHKIYDKWQETFTKWCKTYPDLKKRLDTILDRHIPEDILYREHYFKAGESIATRVSANRILNEIAQHAEFIVSGSADLASSTKTTINHSGVITAGNYDQQNIQYGIREHAMGSIANGMYIYGTVHPVIGTFLSFMPYMKPAMRMAAMMRIPIVYLFSHDSIYVGEDGPTHQPIEHLNVMRIIPNMNVMRPCDAYEVQSAWQIALSLPHTPSAIITTRQNLPVLDHSRLADYKNAKFGGYIIKKEKTDNIDLIIIASGSEVEISIKAAEMLEEEGHSIRVVSMFSTYIFDHQDDNYKNEVLPVHVTKRLGVEAGNSLFMARYAGVLGKTICIDRFGISGKAEDLGQYFGFTTENIFEKAKALLS